ncbi:hypothetical protein [Kitasatospora sp. NPDC090308]|uniref:hypothetical protein n=1 Tax=Kitasatospora sp. NPDC090308 TaxID=3364082 RepID=UPI003818BB44
MAANGAEPWRSVIEPEWTHARGHRPGCGLSVDGRRLWLYRPDAMAGRGCHDHWTVLDAGTGARLAPVELPTVGHGGEHFAHPDGEMLLCVGEGQDGIAVFRGTVADGVLRPVPLPWTDRCLIALPPDGSHFLTVDHGQTDFAVHAHPGGEVVRSATVDDFGHDGERWEAVVEWSGGHLDRDTLAVVLYGEDAETGREWFRSHRADARTGRDLDAFDSGARDCYDLCPLGDGSRPTTDESGHPVRGFPPAEPD